MTGQKLVEMFAKWIGSFVALSEAQAVVCALWVMHTHLSERFQATPYLEISAATKRSGKTTLLETLGMLCRNPQLFATVRVLTVCRMIEGFNGMITCGFDEAERLSSSSIGDTRSMLATGYRQGQYHAVTVGKGFAKFPVFCPKMFALIGNLTPVLRDRSIPIYLDRAKPERSLSAEHTSATAEAENMVAVMRGYFATVQRLNITVPMWLDGREQEIWTPIFSIAQALDLHKSTLDMLTAASVDMGQLKTAPARVWHSAQDEQDADERGAAERVLADLLTVLREGEPAIFSAVAVDRLKAIHTSPWRTYKGTGLDALTLAALLTRYGLQPAVVQMGKGRKGREVARGYKTADIRKARG